ncbi:MAG: ATP-grasp domain-containing protein, partial [Myxococcales bacterium]|nr:ATP-grasp domain-containing protein [Myxococcales bacterium]
MFKKVLVANRGEIAVRVMRSLRELGVRTVAVYSTADAEAMHVRFADEAVCVGPPAARESYLNIANIMAAADTTGCDAVHPGYGFLSENVGFAEVCQSSGLAFIGPSAKLIAQMGDKVEARRLVRQMGGPVVPGIELSEEATIEEAASAAETIGYPMMIKARGGGGGKGIKVVHVPSKFTSAYGIAKAEASRAFGTAGLYLEKHLDRARHVEVQILGDRHGSVIHLGNRECSIQRRFQKLIEEAQAPSLDAEVAAEMSTAAVMIAESIGYDSAGTVEFLVDRDQRFYFLEMNTRIQVEHPV